MAHPTRIFTDNSVDGEMYRAFEEYKLDLKFRAEEWLKIQYVGKEGGRVSDAYKLPMSLEGFYRFCYDNYGCVHQYFENKDQLYTAFVGVCTRIRNEIREDQITGGLLKVYDTSITARLNNLREGVDVEQKVSRKVSVSFKKARGEQPSGD